MDCWGHCRNLGHLPFLSISEAEGAVGACMGLVHVGSVIESELLDGWGEGDILVCFLRHLHGVILLLEPKRVSQQRESFGLGLSSFWVGWCAGVRGEMVDSVHAHDGVVLSLQRLDWS